MQQEILLSGKDAILVAIPFVFILLIGIFRLDEVFATPKGRLVRRRPMCGLDERGEPIFTDPDGRLVTPQRRNKARR